MEFNNSNYSINRTENNIATTDDIISIDATHCPDLIPAFVVLAFYSPFITQIKGTHRLINKESNRRDVLVNVFSMLGGKIKIDGNSFIIRPSTLSGGIVDSHNDHRIAMALGIAGKVCKSPLTITRAECVNKTYPNF